MADTQPPSPRTILGVVCRPVSVGFASWLAGAVPSVGQTGGSGWVRKNAIPVGVGLLVVLGAIASGTIVGADPSSIGGGTTAAIAPAERTAHPATNTTSTTASPASNASLGGSISSFMQASQADAAVAVDSGLFAAKFNDSNASERSRLVHARTAELERRLARLEQQRARLRNATSNGAVTPAERARAAELAARANALQDAVNQTETAAVRADVRINTTRLDVLRGSAQNLTGPEVADVATGLVDIDRRGPPDSSVGVGQGQQAGRVANGTGNATDGRP